MVGAAAIDGSADCADCATEGQAPPSAPCTGARVKAAGAVPSMLRSVERGVRDQPGRTPRSASSLSELVVHLLPSHLHPQQTQQDFVGIGVIGVVLKTRPFKPLHGIGAPIAELFRLRFAER